MPFTFSHPALVIPFLHARGKYPWLSATGLLTGSIAPDFEKFFRLKLASHYSHTLPSIFYFSCPVALGLSFVFHLLVRRQLLAHLPAALYQRLARYRFFDWLRYFRQHYIGVISSIILGAALHIFWDSFTHVNTFVTRAVPALNRTIWLEERPVPLLQLLTVTNSLVGGLAIIWAVWRMPARPAGSLPTAAARQRYWSIAVVVAAALEIEWVLLTHPRLLSIGIAAVSAMMLGVLVASIYTRQLQVR